MVGLAFQEKGPAAGVCRGGQKLAILGNHLLSAGFTEFLPLA